MARIETSLHCDYCPSWSIWEGLREIRRGPRVPGDVQLIAREGP
jgi:hypothetical protein